jgi:hypothetical protein
MGSLVRRIRLDAARPDPFWPAQLTVLVAIALYVTLPGKLTIGPGWLVPAVEGLLLVALVASTPGEGTSPSPTRQRLAVVLTGILVVATLAGLGLLADAVISEGAAGHGLIEAAIVLWGTIVLVFALLYWELDRGGPVARAQPEAGRAADFLFTQDSPEARELSPGWQPSFVDYLFVALTTSTAYSPTDTMPLTQRAKMAMGVQAVAALVTIGLLIARAVGSLA